MIIVFMLSMATSGCDKTIDTRSKIDSEIAITMMESSSQALQLYFSTTKAYPCCNFLIDVSLKKFSNTIDITFKGVIETSWCLTALGPATARIDLGILKSGTYQLNFYNEHVKQSGELIVSSDSYTTNFVDNSISYFTNIPLNKIPENTLWITINYNEENILLSFLEDLMSLEVTEKSYAKGYYSFESARYPGLYSGFKVEENGNIIYYPDLTNSGVVMGRLFTQSFVFQYSGNTENIKQLIKQYKEQIEIRIYTDRGEQFLSWMY
ncbi:MAG: hypothetical protein PHQ11_05915 [Paludibacter sp.]|nr:hypothetical protein [Paludibacter sp.]